MIVRQSKSKGRSFATVVGAAVLAAALATDASAYVMDLVGPNPDGVQTDSGWSVYMDDDFHTMGLVEIQVDLVDLENGIIILEKSAEFLVTKEIPIQFRQDDVETGGQIEQLIFEAMLITNSTPDDWVKFDEILIDSGDAAFNVADSAGFTIDPFTTRTYSDGNTVVTFSDGVVASGDIWTAGSGVFDGQLVIDVTTKQTQPLTKFWLKERPDVPEPATMVLIALGGAMMLGRRRQSPAA
jgi:hypothetical protein